MKNFQFKMDTEILFGKGKASKLGEEIAKYTDKILLVYGGGSIKKNGIYDDIVKSLDEAGIKFEELSGVKPNPRIESVEEGARICRENGIGGVLAVGGGSTIDCSKVIAAAAVYDGDPWDIVINPKVIEEALPVFTVLTMAATGSETDSAAVISRMETNEKYGTHSPYFLPAVSVLDPSYTFTVPAKHTAAGVADIMSHTFENYFTNEDGYIQSQLALSILKTCVKYGPEAIENPHDYEARANLMIASGLAINGLIAKGSAVPWSVHPIEHELSAFYDVTHGEGLAVLTPAWMRYVLDNESAFKFAEYGRVVFGIEEEEDMKAAQEAIDSTEIFFKSILGIPANLRELGIKNDENFDLMAKKAVKGKSIKGFRELKKEDVREILDMCR